MPRALMFQGTGSDVGKTVLVAGLCCAAKRRGIKVVPFKPQNMSNNAAVAKAENGEGEIGRGQWLQAFASKIEPTRAYESGIAQTTKSNWKSGSGSGKSSGAMQKHASTFL